MLVERGDAVPEVKELMQFDLAVVVHVRLRQALVHLRHCRVTGQAASRTEESGYAHSSVCCWCAFDCACVWRGRRGEWTEGE
eukprot:170714-Rhodomonas_salina.2